MSKSITIHFSAEPASYGPLSDEDGDETLARHSVTIHMSDEEYKRFKPEQLLNDLGGAVGYLLAEKHIHTITEC